MSDSDATLDPDQESDATLSPSDDEMIPPTPPSRQSTQRSQKEKKVLLKKKTSEPYKFTKTSSTVHGISDSGSDDDQPKKLAPKKLPTKVASTYGSKLDIKEQRTTTPSPSLKKTPSGSSVHKQSKLEIKKQGTTTSSTSVHNLSDSESDDEQLKKSVQKKPPAKSSSSNGSKLDRKEQRITTPSPGLKKTPSGSSLLKQSSDRKDRQSPGPSKRSREASPATKPPCQYGSKCFRKNPEHRKEFSHPGDGEEPPSKKPKKDIPQYNISQKYKHGRPLNFFLTTVHGIDREYNATLAMGIKDILSPQMGSLVASAQFNYMTDIPWLVQQYPAEFRTKPLLIVHGEQRQAKAAIDLEATRFPHIKLCQAKLEIMYGTHHTKMMFLLYKEGMRVVIHTSNLIHQDWHQKTQGIWISPLFPKLTNSSDKGDSATMFKHDLLQYIAAYGTNRLSEWEKHIREHDMSNAKVYIIGSVPGRHLRENKSKYGHLKLRKILQSKGPQVRDVHQWPVVGQFSSIGSMGADKEKWLCGEWLQSLSATQGDSVGLGRPKLQLIYPSKDNVRLSLEGYPAGGSLPYSIKVASKQTFLHSFFHVWKSRSRGRTRASPHIKTYSRMSPNGEEISWFLVTSANLSKAAWGAHEKSGSQLMIRSYELGVLFLPDNFGEKTFRIMKDMDEYKQDGLVFPVPYDFPPQPYNKQDVPWIWDIPYTDLPDTNGNAWCPP